MQCNECRAWPCYGFYGDSPWPYTTVIFVVGCQVCSRADCLLSIHRLSAHCHETIHGGKTARLADVTLTEVQGLARFQLYQEPVRQGTWLRLESYVLHQSPVTTAASGHWML